MRTTRLPARSLLFLSLASNIFTWGFFLSPSHVMRGSTWTMTKHPVRTALGAVQHIQQVEDEELAVVQCPRTRRFIETLIDWRLTLSRGGQPVELVVVRPIDEVVQICEVNDDGDLIPLADDSEAVNDMFDTLSYLFEEQELWIRRTAYCLTLQPDPDALFKDIDDKMETTIASGHMEDDQWDELENRLIEEDSDDEEDMLDDEDADDLYDFDGERVAISDSEEGEIIAEMEHEGSEYVVLRYLEPVLFFAKVDFDEGSQKDNYFILQDDEMDQLQDDIDSAMGEILEQTRSGDARIEVPQ